ncbi:shikimate kinase [Psychroserpens algicola]|uniref:shikimate kinase n=1 Tax=Psychroserpens algicola TaxID=1719034 RepID=UPI00195437E2|nr:shikimate kinase [Psychroserpens algicola]
MILFLVGYMGSGKSVVGQQLSEILGYNYIDFDDYIERKENATIRTIFETKGEIYFRKAESSYLKDLSKLKETIVSLGGGTPCYGDNMQTLLNTKESVCVYLKASIPTLTKRLFNERAKRPLLAHIDSESMLSEFIGKHIFERAPFYEQSSLSIQTDDKSISEIVEAIVLKLF